MAKSGVKRTSHPIGVLALAYEIMSRAFVNDDADEVGPRYSLPPRDDPSYPMAAARALLAGANRGDTMSAEDATGFAWGDPRLVDSIRLLLEEAEERDDDRSATLAERFLKAAAERA
jgi:hypothetical protein